MTLTILALILSGGAPAPILTAGHKALTFTATDVHGKKVHFPADFKGKIVLLDFWATWCGPCMEEVPNIVKTYKQFHPKGFEILGISLDRGATIKDIKPVTKDQHMSWDQVVDGPKFTTARSYQIETIPHAFIVNGTTGKIIAEGDAIRGDALVAAVQKAMGSKSGR
jgi:thiol-disulfide isomerase/thioredoxin